MECCQEEDGGHIPVAGRLMKGQRTGHRVDHLQLHPIFSVII